MRLLYTRSHVSYHIPIHNKYESSNPGILFFFYAPLGPRICAAKLSHRNFVKRCNISLGRGSSPVHATTRPGYYSDTSLMTLDPRTALQLLFGRNARAKIAGHSCLSGRSCTAPLRPAAICELRQFGGEDERVGGGREPRGHKLLWLGEQVQWEGLALAGRQADRRKFSAPRESARARPITDASWRLRRFRHHRNVRFPIEDGAV